MKAKFASYLAMAALLPITAVFAADDTNKDDPKAKPRPAQESRGANVTGKESTKPVDKNNKEYAPSSANTGAPVKPLSGVENAQTQPRPAQESRSGAVTGRDATKSPEREAKPGDTVVVEKEKKTAK